MNFSLQNNKNLVQTVMSANSYCQSNNLSINWGISSFGFGQFNFYTKNNKTFCDNEMCGINTVSAVLKKAVWDMIYTEYEELSLNSIDLSKKEAQEIFAIGKNGFRILRHAQSRKIIDGILFLSYFDINTYTKTNLIFDSKTFPDLTDDANADFILSEYLEQEEWEGFIKADNIVWSKTCIKEDLMMDKNPELILEANIQIENEEIKIHWKTSKNSGYFLINNNPYVIDCNINTFGQSKFFVMDVLNKAMENVILCDINH